jgi:NagD protein
MQIHESFTEWFQKHRGGLDALMFDIDGVLTAGGVVVPGSLELIRSLRATGFPFALLTNDGNHSVAEKTLYLNRHGFGFGEEEITSCADGLVEVVAQQGLAGKLFFVLGDTGEPCYAARAGLRVTRDAGRVGACDGVYVSEENYAWDVSINAALNHLLKHPGLPFLVPNPDEYYPSKGGMIHVAAGGVARFIQRVAEVYGVRLNPTYLGKPYLPIFEHSHRLLERRLGCEVKRGRVLMLGDSLAADIRGANDFGYRSGLLLTGITKESHFSTATVHPTHVFRGF